MALKSNLYYFIRRDEIVGFNTTNYRKTYESANYAHVLMVLTGYDL